jgi:hypothetical protein
LLNGSLKVEPEAGKGTTIAVIIPLHPVYTLWQNNRNLIITVHMLTLAALDITLAASS